MDYTQSQSGFSEEHGSRAAHSRRIGTDTSRRFADLLTLLLGSACLVAALAVLAFTDRSFSAWFTAFMLGTFGAYHLKRLV